jgi:hypothetical protein
MKIPFVARTTYDLLKQQFESSEKERRELLDRLLVMTGSAPVYTPAHTPAEVAPAARGDDETQDFVSGPITIDRVVAMAQAAADKKSKVGMSIR